MSVMLLMVPAVYNGFPLIFYDTGGYIERWLDLSVGMGRSLPYGLFIGLSAGGLSPTHGSLWGTVIVQAALSVWLIHLTARTVLSGDRPILLLFTCAALAGVTGLPWYTGQIMPDIMEPLMVLGVYLLAFQRERLGRVEQSGLVGMVVLAEASHMAFLVLGMGLLAVLLLSRVTVRHWWPALDVRLPALGVGGGIAVLLAINLGVAGHVGFTPGGPTFLFGRMAENGIAQRFLDDHCPSAAYQLCAYRQKMPKTTDGWIWAEDSPLRKIGGWDNGADEMGRIIRESFVAYPAAHLEAGLAATAAQFTMVATGDGLDENYRYHADGVIETRLPLANGAYRASIQKGGGLDLTILNRLQVPLALAALPLTVFMALWLAVSGGRLTAQPIAALGILIALSLIGNAVICGALSGPADRYQNRLIWIAVFYLILVVRYILEKGPPGFFLTRQPNKTCRLFTDWIVSIRGRRF